MTGQPTPLPIGRQSSFLTDVSKLVGGTALAQTLSVLLAPLLARLYSPDAFGTAAVFASIATMIGTVACLRYEFSIMLPKRNDDAANLLAVSLCSAAAVTALSAILILAAGERIVRLLNAPQLAGYLWLVPLAVLPSGAFLALNHWNSRAERFGTLAIARTSQSLLTNCVQLGIAALGHAHAGALISARVFGSAFAAAGLGAQVWYEDHTLLATTVRWSRMSELVRRYRKFPLVDLWGAVVNSLSWQLPPLLLSAFFSQTVVGHYALANRVIQLPMVLVGGAISQVLFQRASLAHATGSGTAPTIERVLKGLVAMGLLPALLLTLIGEDLFVMVFGHNWSEAGIYGQILGLWAFSWFVSSPLHVLFAVAERQEFALIGHVAILVTRVVALVAGGLTGSVHLALSLFGASGIVVYIALAMWTTHLAGVPLRRFASIVLKQLLFGLPFVMALVCLKLWFAESLWIVVSGALVALAAQYVLLFRRDPDVRGILRRGRR